MSKIVLDGDTEEVRKSADQAVLDSILKAIFEQRIPPGTKLNETKLADAFGVGRGRIRRVLLSLSHHKVVDLHPNRGAFVAHPKKQDARDVFRVREFLEGLIVASVIERASAANRDQLRTHVKAEREARDLGNRRDAIRMAGEFHLMLARITESKTFYDMMEMLLSQSSLILGLYGAGLTSSCSVEEHESIVEAIEKRDVDAAKHVMGRHLEDLEGALQLDSADEREVDFASIFTAVAK